MDKVQRSFIRLITFKPNFQDNILVNSAIKKKKKTVIFYSYLLPTWRGFYEAFYLYELLNGKIVCFKRI